MGRVVLTCRMLMGPAILAAALSGCTMKQTEAPPLQGPSELSLAFNLSAIPDVLSQDGASQSQIVVQARDANGQPARSVTFRADIVVGSTLTDFGALSARTLVTDSNGRATLTYTAPASTTGVDSGQQVAIRITPLGTDFANSLSRAVSIRLIPPGVLLPGGPTPPATPITVSPASPAAFVDVTFSTSGWTPAAGTQIASYTWNFGDGSTASGAQVFHRYTTPGSFIISLMVTDTNGVSASAQQSVAVGAGAVPTANFVFSPSAPSVNQDIFFNGSTSTAGVGRSIVRYDWDFGSGAPKSGLNVTKSYDTAGTYSVVLTVTDDVGQTATVTKTVTVTAAAGGALTASFTFSPTAPTVSQTVFFNASGSTTPTGTTVTSYAWDFGDGGTTSGITPTHAFGAAGTYVVRLTLTNSSGQTASVTQNVTVTAVAGGALTAAFTFSPTAPSVSQTVFFNGTGSTTPAGTTITSYAWDFGDGSSATGATPSHTFATAASYVVRLAVTNSASATATTTQTVVITAGGSALSADFTFSPTGPVSGTLVNFNANVSSPIAAINQFDWDFGDGTSVIVAGVNNFTVNHAFTTTNTFTYTVRLTVHDTSGRTATVTKGVPVTAGSAPIAAFTISASPATVGVAVTFDGVPSAATAPATITRYTWNFGDGSAIVSTTAPTTTIAHTYVTGNTYTITLTVTDSNGRTDSTSHTLLVQ